MGAGFSARALHEHRVNLTIVEIDPVVYEFSREYFGVEVPTGEVVLEDAREFLKRNSSMVSAFIGFFFLHRTRLTVYIRDLVW